MDKKLLIFLGIFFTLFFAYQKFVIDPMVKKQPAATRPPAATTPAPKAGSQPGTTQPAPSGSSAEAVPPAVSQQLPATQSVPARIAIVETPLYRAEFRNTGAVLQSFRLKKYTDDFNQPLEMVPQIKDMTVRHPMSLDFDNKDATKIAEEAIYAMDRENVKLENQDKQSISFTYSDGRHSFRKIFNFQANSYIIHMTVEATDAGKILPPRVVWAPGIEDASNYKDPSALREPHGLINNGEKVERKTAR